MVLLLMEYGRHILPSSFEPHDTTFEDVGGLSRIRQPLASSAGNAQHNTLASDHYHDDKSHHPRFDGNGHMYPLPALPSQPFRPSAGYTLEQRRHSVRQRRDQRFKNSTRNPIVDSPQYQAYRSRQTKEGSGDDQKWPPVLEDAFIDALGIIPYMGRRKFSYRGKPHGRNELIMEFIWIYYLQSLPPGEVPDESMRRTRKQVSSHIQVIKAFMKNHPDFHKIFPSKEPKPLNGFEPSFKNDPCLRAISEGRLPSRRFHRFNDQQQQQQQQQYEEELPRPTRAVHSGPIRPSLFWLLITTHEIPEEQNGRFSNEEDLYKANVIAHKFSSLSAEGSRASLESIPNWQRKFPALEQLRASGNLKCDIIHMDVSLNLMNDYPEAGAELCCRTELSIPGRAPNSCQWISRTTLTKPPELCRDPINDPAIEAKDFRIGVVPSNDNETRFKVPFPANAWANVFVQLISIQNRYHEMRRSRTFDGEVSVKSARQCIEELSMYQEIVSSTATSTGERTPLVRRAIIVWTFHKSRQDESNATSWRYIDATYPPRRACMSPSPHSSHHVNASMYENFSNSFLEPSPQMHHQQHQQSSMLDFVNPGLATPPQTAGLQSPFGSHDYNAFNQPSNLPFDIPNDNLSFMSNKTANSESTLVEHQPSASHGTHLDYLSTNISLPEYVPHSSWTLPTASSENFDADPAWASYAAAAAAQEASQVASQMNWDASTSALVDNTKDDGRESDWQDLPPIATPRHHQQQRQHDLNRQSQQRREIQAGLPWEDAHTPAKHADWLSPPLPHPHNTPCKPRPILQGPNLIEQSIEQRLLPWIEHHNTTQLQPAVQSSHDLNLGEGSEMIGNSLVRSKRGEGAVVDNSSLDDAAAAANSILDLTVLAMAQGGMEGGWVDGITGMGGEEGSGGAQGQEDDGLDYAGMEARLKQ